MMSKRFAIKLLTIVTFLFLGCGIAQAAPNLSNVLGNVNDAGDKAGYQVGGPNAFDIFSAFITAVISIIGVVFIALMIYAGYLWMTARGNEEQVTKAKNLITAAVIGIIIVFAAYAISYFVISKVWSNTLKQ